MIFCVSDVQRLIVAAGGDVKPGTPLKTYFWKLSQELLALGVEAKPRTLERAWREGYLSERVSDALKKTATQRALNDEFKLLGDFENLLDRLAASSDKGYLPKRFKILRTGLTWVRWALTRRYEVAVMAGCLKLAQAADREAASEAAE